MRLEESRVRRLSLRENAGLGLFMGLRPIREHYITHKDTCSLLSLIENGILDISRARVFL